jgi:hypothetical protein
MVPGDQQPCPDSKEKTPVFTGNATAFFKAQRGVSSPLTLREIGEEHDPEAFWTRKTIEMRRDVCV